MLFFYNKTSFNVNMFIAAESPLQTKPKETSSNSMYSMKSANFAENQSELGKVGDTELFAQVPATDGQRFLAQEEYQRVSTYESSPQTISRSFTGE